MNLATLRNRLARLDRRPRQGRLTRSEAAELARLEAEAEARRALDVDQLTDEQLDQLLLDLSAGAGPSRLAELKRKAMTPRELARQARERAEYRRRIEAMTDEELDRELNACLAGVAARHERQGVDHAE